MKITVEVDDESFYNMIRTELKDCQEMFRSNLLEACPNIFIYDDPVKDKILIQAHIDALELIIDWYG